VAAVTGNSMGYIALACAAVSAEHGFAIADAMGLNSQGHEPGGQTVIVMAGEDWRVDPATARAVAAACAKVGVLPSIRLGGMLVVAGPESALDALAAQLPPLPRPPLRLAGHGPVSAPLMHPSAAAARGSLPVSWFGVPRVPLIDGSRRKYGGASKPKRRRCGTILFGHQILQPYDFTVAMNVALREFAPDRVVLLGPGETLGGAIGQVLIGLDWLNTPTNRCFPAAREDAFLIAMGRPAQRKLAERLAGSLCLT